MRPVVITDTKPRQRKFSHVAQKYADFERHVFDTATMFVVSGYKGRGDIYRAEFATLPEAIAHHAVAPCRCCVYAVNAPGRQIVLDRKDWPDWLSRLEEKPCLKI